MENGGVLKARIRLVEAASRSETVRRPHSPTVRVVQGFEAIVAVQGMLVELGRRTGQSGAMEWLDYFVRSPDSLQKRPYLLLVGNGRDGSVESDPLSADDLMGAALVYEYQVAGVGTKVFSTDDSEGIRNVVAPDECRIEVADIALRRLMKMGAVAALISIDGGMEGRRKPPSTQHSAYRVASRTRTIPHHLVLRHSFDETLAAMGPHTRRNLRYYRRRAEADLGVSFVQDVEMDREEFLEMNRRSTNPADEAVTNWRYSLHEGAATPGDLLFSGLRARNGSWLSLVGGRHHGATTEIDWQMNLAGLPRYSLTTVMRAFLIEHEIARGTRKLIYRGGTPHSMRFAFATTELTDLLAVRRWSGRAWALKKFSRWIFPEKNFLGAALREMTGEEPQMPAAPRPDVKRDLSNAA